MWRLTSTSNIVSTAHNEVTLFVIDGVGRRWCDITESLQMHYSVSKAMELALRPARSPLGRRSDSSPLAQDEDPSLCPRPPSLCIAGNFSPIDSSKDLR